MAKKLISQEALANICDDSSIKTFEDLESNYGLTQKYIYNRLYVSCKDVIPQSELDRLRCWYKELAKNSGVSPYVYNEAKKKKKNIKEEGEVIISVEDEEDEFEGRVVGESVRGLDGKIKEYRYKILVHGKDPIEGSLTLNQMQTLYFQYSNEGAKLSARKVLESFPQFNINELKKVLRAFKITKDCKPFAPHFVESHTEEELKELLLQYSVDRVAKSAVKDEIKYKNSIITDQAKEIEKLKQERSNIEEWTKDIDFRGFEIKRMSPIPNSGKTLILYPSDWHIGCYLKPTSTFYHPYDLPEIKRRIDKMISPFLNMHFEEIIVANLGDTIDGFGGQTSRGGHILPQIQEGDKEIYKWFMEAMTYLFDLIHTNLKFEKIRYYAVGESNHGGTGEWICQKSFENLLNNRYPNVQTCISDEVYSLFKVYNENFIITHGKDDLNMFKNLPLTVNNDPKAQLNILNIMLDKFGISKANFIKGDLHQSATTFGFKFRYRSVGCMLGSSEWTGANFGDNDAYLDYDIVNTKGEILEGRIKLN